MDSEEGSGVVSIILFEGRQLSLQSADSFLGLSPSRFHLAQLAAQRLPLQNGGTESEKANNHQQPGRSDQPAGYSYKWGLVGALIIGLGAALLRLAMELFYKADKAQRFSAAAWICFAVSGAMIVHGLIYACTGWRGLEVLYVL